MKKLNLKQGVGVALVLALAVACGKTTPVTQDQKLTKFVTALSKSKSSGRASTPELIAQAKDLDLEHQILAFYYVQTEQQMEIASELLSNFNRDKTATAEALAALISQRDPEWNGSFEEESSFTSVLSDVKELPLTPALEKALQKAISAKGDDKLIRFLLDRKGFENAELVSKAYRKFHLAQISGQSPRAGWYSVFTATDIIQALAKTKNPVVVPALIESLAVADNLKKWPLKSSEEDRYSVSVAAADALSNFPDTSAIEALLSRAHEHTDDGEGEWQGITYKNANNLSAHYVMGVINMKTREAYAAVLEWLEVEAKNPDLRKYSDAKTRPLVYVVSRALNNARLNEPTQVSADRLAKVYKDVFNQETLPAQEEQLTLGNSGEYIRD